MLPGETSDAIDAADCTASSEQDQRGATLPASGCDIGAVEVEGTVPDLPASPVQIFAVSSPGGGEGNPVAVYAVAAGPDNENLSYAFDCDNNGDYETAGTGSGAVGSGSCTFSDDGNYTVDVQVCDGRDASNCDTDSTDVFVSNLAPQISTGGSATILEGTLLSRTGTFYDPGSDTWTAKVDYGDGGGVRPLALASAGFTLEHVYTDGDNDPYTVTVCVADDDGGEDCNSFSVDVVSGSELAEVLDATLTEPIAASELPKSIKIPMLEKLAEIEASLEAREFSLVCGQLHAFGNYVESQEGEQLPPELGDAILSIVDIFHTFLGCTVILDPTITDVTNDGPVIEGSPATISVTAVDGAGGTDPLTYAFDCDSDGSYEINGSDNQAQCTYPDDGSFTVGVQVSDEYGGSTTDSTTVVVDNVAPLVESGDNGTVDEGALLSQPGSFTDPGADTWTATVDYGDGGGAQPIALDGFSFILSHSYGAGDEEPYTVTVCVTDDDGGVGCDNFEVEVLSASDQITLLATTIEEMHLHPGMSESLLSKLATIPASIEAGMMTRACNQLGAFSNHVEAQAGKKLTQAQVDQLLADAERIRATLGCG